MRPRIIGRFEEMAEEYDGLICDIWGVYHDGLRVFPAASAVLRGFRAGGGVVVFLTNAPRPCGSVARMLDRIGGSEEDYNEIVTSGDAARQSLAEGVWGSACFHLGPARDLPLVEGLEVRTVGLAEAEFVLCTGFLDATVETPASHAGSLRDALLRGLPMLCSNPDLAVDRGDVQEPCAGAIARLYERMGGSVVYYGKPHRPIYERAFEALRRASPAPLRKVLAIGDGIATDVPGAAAAGLDCLYVTGGMARDEIAHDPAGRPEAGSLAAFLARHGACPQAAIGMLA